MSSMKRWVSSRDPIKSLIFRILGQSSVECLATLLRIGQCMIQKIASHSAAALKQVQRSTLAAALEENFAVEDFVKISRRSGIWKSHRRSQMIHLAVGELHEQHNFIRTSRTFIKKVTSRLVHGIGLSSVQALWRLSH